MPVGKKPGRLTVILLLFLVLLGANMAWATVAGDSAHSEISEVLLGLIVIILAAKIGGDLVERIGQPAVLGELIFGIIIGNLPLVGVTAFEPFKHSLTLEVLAEIGIIILLFDIGLGMSIAEMTQVGVMSFLVAAFGVIAPFFFGWGVSAWLMPDKSIYVHVFIGATLTATSVGITARVLKDIGKEATTEARIILGAAVIDDIIGLLILAGVVGIITAAAGGGSGAGSIVVIIVKALAFVVGALVIGRFVTPRIFYIGSKMQVKGMLLSIALMVCFGLAYAANLIGLAPIVGAFAAGLILDRVHYKEYLDRGEHDIGELISPIATFLVPIFFVRMGMLVDLRSFGQTEILIFAAILTVAAVLGKQACSLAVLRRPVDRLSIGLGMIPRGEVGLIFAGIGSKLALEGSPIITPEIFSAIVIMVMATTLVTPPLLKWSLLRSGK